MSVEVVQELPPTLYKKERRSLPDNVHIEPVTSSTLASYRRLITLLLPIRYPDKFYKDSVANTTETSLARVALWHEKNSTEPKVIGGIQCRLENISAASAAGLQLYVQTIGVLAPYRQLGIATHLLESIVITTIRHYENVTSIYAHVWEANTEALEWYAYMGFTLEKEVLGDYYRRLKPSGARIVRRRITVQDHLAAKELDVVQGAEVKAAEENGAEVTSTNGL